MEDQCAGKLIQYIMKKNWERNYPFITIIIIEKKGDINLEV